MLLLPKDILPLWKKDKIDRGEGNFDTRIYGPLENSVSMSGALGLYLTQGKDPTRRMFKALVNPRAGLAKD